MKSYNKGWEMTKATYNYEVLTKALDILNRYEDSKNSFRLPSDLKLFHYLDIFMTQLKIYIQDLDGSNSQKQHIIDTFKVLTEISFDKLERDVMGVN